MKTNKHFLFTARSVLVRMRNVSRKCCRGNQNTRFMFNNFFFEIRVVYARMWKRIWTQTGHRLPMARAYCMLYTKDKNIHS